MEVQTSLDQDTLIEIQLNLLNKIDTTNTIHLEDIHTVAGIDSAYWSADGIDFGVGCVVVIDYETHEVLEQQYSYSVVTTPYIPSLLAFRELPLVMEALSKVETQIDLYMFDGNGYLHPRHLGLATHAGILLNKPSIGVAKTLYKVGEFTYSLADSVGSVSDIVVSNEVYGRAIRTVEGVKPIYVSIGNKIDLDTATVVVNSLIGKGSHIPIPIRLADIETHKLRKEIQSR